MQEGDRGAFYFWGGQVAELEEGLEIDELPQMLGDIEATEYVDEVLEDVLADGLVDGFVHAQARLIIDPLIDTPQSLTSIISDTMKRDILFILISCLPVDQMNALFIHIQQFFRSIQ